MPKKEEGHCCCGQGKFWWGVLAGVILAAALHAIVMCCWCPMRGGPGCPMMGGPAAMEKAPAK